MPSKVEDGAQRGWIIPIGGAEEKQCLPGYNPQGVSPSLWA